MARADAELGPVTGPLTEPSSDNGAGRPSFSLRMARRERKPAKLKPSYGRTYRQTICKVDLWAVLKLAICFYLAALLVLLFSGVVLWWIAAAFGVISNVENFVGDLVNSDDFKILSWSVLRASALVGLVIVSLLVVSTVLAAAFYNLFSSVLGGVEVTITEEETVTRP